MGGEKGRNRDVVVDEGWVELGFLGARDQGTLGLARRVNCASSQAHQMPCTN